MKSLITILMILAAVGIPGRTQTTDPGDSGPAIRAAMARGMKFKNEVEFFDEEITKNMITKRNMVTATKQIYVLNDWDRIAYAAAYGNGHLLPLTEDVARTMLIDSILVVVKVSAWGSAGIAKEIKNARNSIVVVTAGDKRVVPSKHTMRVGSLTSGLPIYQATTMGNGNSSLTVVNNTGDAFAHGTIYLSSLFSRKELNDLSDPALSVFRMGDTKRLASVSTNWLLSGTR